MTSRNIFTSLLSLVVAVSAHGCAEHFATEADASADASGATLALCIPGEQNPCACEDGRSGSQRCLQDRSGFAECTCSAPGSDVADTSTSDAGTSADAGEAASNAEQIRVDSGAQSATATDAGSGLQSLSDAAPPGEGCARALPGPLGVEVRSAESAPYCIDATEVTNEHYADFLDATPGLDGLPAACAFKSSFVPGGVWPADVAELPVTHVDWCDAWAYCAWAGKQLCGDVEGGAVPYADFSKSNNAWFTACSNDGTTTYPYGSTFDSGACVGTDYDGLAGYQPATDVAHAPGSARRCRNSSTELASLSDMSGNVAEWEDSCDATTGSQDLCRLRGSSFRLGQATTMRCSSAGPSTRNARASFIGFRCCFEP